MVFCDILNICFTINLCVNYSILKYKLNFCMISTIFSVLTTFRPNYYKLLLLCQKILYRISTTPFTLINTNLRYRLIVDEIFIFHNFSFTVSFS